MDSTADTPLPERIDPSDEKGLKCWSEHFGATNQQLIEAVKAVGGDPEAVRRHLLDQGASSGVG
jgi:Protein of unknown function (DUF3606)